MKQAATIHDLKLPMLLPGITMSTSADDFAPIKQMQLQKFDGKTWKLFGDVISGSGRPVTKKLDGNSAENKTKRSDREGHHGNEQRQGNKRAS